MNGPKMDELTDYISLLHDIREMLDVDGGLVTSIEHPGCIVIPHADGSGNEWWFGTANATWMGDLMTPDGSQTLETLDTGVPSTETNAGKVAIGIQRVLMGE